MSWFKTFTQKQRGNPILLLVAGIGFTFSFYGFYKYKYSPWVSRRRHLQHESYANFLYEKQSKPKDL